ncbi:MAG: acyl--CoA ligase, partial [Burkholderiales bacterium]
AEVEEALRQILRVQQVCVLAVPDARLDEVPAAVVVGANGVEWSGVVDQLRQRLAGFKIPRAIYKATELPVTATNRVQRATLREWIASGRLERVL